jgi:ParB family transcriptional regulator, chromosome partitioning protein
MAPKDKGYGLLDDDTPPIAGTAPHGRGRIVLPPGLDRGNDSSADLAAAKSVLSPDGTKLRGAGDTAGVGTPNSAGRNVAGSVADGGLDLAAAKSVPGPDHDAIPQSGKRAGAGSAYSLGQTVRAEFADVMKAREAEQRLTAGSLIVELDPAVVDPSFITDRMEQQPTDYASLKTAIETHGQDSPILVRPHPEKEGRYQVAFGHRRLRICEELGRKVRAVIRDLTDQELVVAQGQENSARMDRSFIETALYAQTLIEHGYDRKIAVEALAVDMGNLSRYLTVAKQLPLELIRAIGPARPVGRDRWVPMAKKWNGKAMTEALAGVIGSQLFIQADSEKRFGYIHDFIMSGQAPIAGKPPAKPPKEEVVTWERDGKKIVSMVHKARSSVLSVDGAVAKDFAEFLLSRMDRLFDEYEAEQDEAGHSGAAA